MYNALRPSVWIEDHKGVSQSGLITETLKELCVNKASWNDMERHDGVVDRVAVAFPMGAICSTSTYDNLLFESVDWGDSEAVLDMVCARLRSTVRNTDNYVMYLRSTGVH